MTHRDPHEPVALYEGPRLVSFRGWPLVGVVVAACLLGVGLDRALLAVRDELARRTAVLAHGPSTAGALVGAKLRAATLFGDDEGIAVKLPPSRVTLVHVWLEGCADCMTAFEAMGRLRADPALVDVPTINVAYGRATAAFAERYGVDRSLVFDASGSAVVAPLGISSFTTLLVAPDGTVLHRDRPDRDGFVQRVQAAYGAAHAYETSISTTKATAAPAAASSAPRPPGPTSATPTSATPTSATPMSATPTTTTTTGTARSSTQ